MTTQSTPKASEFLKSEIEKGINGQNEGIPLNGRLSNQINIRKAALHLLGGFAGSGKTSFADEMYVLQPFDWLKSVGLLGKYKVTYWSMERPKAHKLAKWLSRYIFLGEGIMIPFPRILGWFNRTQPLSLDELNLIDCYMPILDEIFDTTVNFYSGRINPTGIRKYIREEMLQYGTLDDSNKFNRVFYPNDPSIIHLDFYDHIGKLKSESGKSRKEVLDDFSDDCSNEYRDLYGRSSLFISQFNRSIANPIRIKNGDVEPVSEDFKETGDIYEDCDVALTIFDPWRYKVPDPSGYDLSKLRDESGIKFYRNIKLLKNNYGAEDLKYGYAYEPITGYIKVLPKLKDMTTDIYNSVLNRSYFFDEQRRMG